MGGTYIRFSGLATETFSPLPTALHPVGTSTQVPPGVETRSLRQHPFARRCTWNINRSSATTRYTSPSATSFVVAA